MVVELVRMKYVGTLEEVLTLLMMFRFAVLRTCDRVGRFDIFWYTIFPHNVTTTAWTNQHTLSTIKDILCIGEFVLKSSTLLYKELDSDTASNAPETVTTTVTMARTTGYMLLALSPLLLLALATISNQYIVPNTNVQYSRTPLPIMSKSI